MFNETDFAKLDFLIGRWVGAGPDGKPFYEEYDRTDSATLRSRRFKDDAFAEVTDGSEVSLKDGIITSTWGEFTWEADRIEEGLASFSPANAPSAFTWKKSGADIIEVTQNWIDESGKPQTYTIMLQRVR